MLGMMLLCPTVLSARLYLAHMVDYGFIRHWLKAWELTGPLYQKANGENTLAGIYLWFPPFKLIGMQSAIGCRTSGSPMDATHSPRAVGPPTFAGTRGRDGGCFSLE